MTQRKTEMSKWKDASLHKYYGSYEWKQYKVETDDGVWTAYFRDEYLGYHKDEEKAKQVCENHYKLSKIERNTF